MGSACDTDSHCEKRCPTKRNFRGFVHLCIYYSFPLFADRKLNVIVQGDADVAKAMEVSSADVGKQSACLVFSEM